MWLSLTCHSTLHLHMYPASASLTPWNVDNALAFRGLEYRGLDAFCKNITHTCQRPLHIGDARISERCSQGRRRRGVSYICLFRSLLRGGRFHWTVSPTGSIAAFVPCLSIALAQHREGARLDAREGDTVPQVTSLMILSTIAESLKLPVALAEFYNALGRCQ